jgi:hypothetical protein
VTARIGLDGAWVGANHGDSWFSFLAEPGEHHLCANWQPAALVEGFVPAKLVSPAGFRAEAGNVYYFRVRIEAPDLKQGPLIDMEPVSKDEAEFLIASYPFSTSHPKK